MTRILLHVFFLTLLSPIKNIACITLHMVGLTLRRDAIFWPRDLSAWDQYEIQMLRISWVTRGSANASTHRQINRSCLSGAQTRIFSYSDTQRHRLGPNYLQLPVNAPKSAHHNNHHEGFMNFMHRDEEVNYFPSRFDPVRHAEQFPVPPAVYTGKREKCIIEKENNFKQPGERYRSWAPDRQERFIRRWVDALSDPRVTHEIRSIWISYWSQACKSLGQKLASRLNVRPSIWGLCQVKCLSSQQWARRQCERTIWEDITC